MADDENKESASSVAPLFGLIALVVGLVLGYFVGSGQFGTASLDLGQEEREAEETEVQLVNHIQAEFPEQDVFVETSPGSDEVFRVDVGEVEEYGDSMLYATTSTTEHDPFKLGEEPLGPFEKGESLGFTLNEWLSGTGSGTYTVNGSTATLELSMQNLVPNGVYTVWCSVLRLPPEPLIADLPCGALDGSDNVLTADEDGNAETSITMSPLQPSTESVANVIALAYHSDGETHGTEPGPFGLTTHVQLFYLMPPPEGE